MRSSATQPPGLGTDFSVRISLLQILGLQPKETEKYLELILLASAGT